MNKGCVIAIIVVLVLGAIGTAALTLGVLSIGGCVYFGAKYGMQAENAGIAFAVETAIAEYQRQNPDAKVEPTNEAWATALQNFKIPGGAGQQDLAQFIKEGEIVDIAQQPMIISQNPDGSIKVSSPGKDGQPGTADDVDSSMFKNLQEKAEAASQK